uniref:G-protein coupled receptors family 1 profile domain-containing protein n=1 Tax=Phlebotomus papatasi TaxID=29031 RepID=A0A1B0DGN0_PHLPP
MSSLSHAVAVAVAFFLCWAPFHAQVREFIMLHGDENVISRTLYDFLLPADRRLMAVYGQTVETPPEIFYNIYTALTYISGVLYFLSTCINPLLYNIMSHKFRDAFK